MKVEKIVITKEPMEVSSRRVKIPKVDIFTVGNYSSNDNFQSSNTIIEEDWIVEHVYNPMDKKVSKKYLIKVDERGLFTELITIHDDILNKELLNEYNKGIKEAYHKGYSNALNFIRGLSWLKRLFNDF